MKRRIIGILAAGAMMAMAAVAHAETPTVKICTGGKSGNYFAAGNDIATQLKGKVNFEVIATGGSMANFSALTKHECQYAIVQADTILEWTARGNPDTDIEEVDSLYREYFHMVVNSHEAPNVNQSFDKVDKTVKIMRDGPDSGTAATWNNLVRADKARNGDKGRLVSVPTVPEGGVGTVGKLRSGKDAQAVLFMSGVGSGIMKRVNNQALDDKGKKYLCLVDMDDSGMFGNATWEKITNGAGKKLYEKATFDRNSGYSNLLCNKSSVSTFSTNAIVVVDRAWKTANPDMAEQIADAIMSARPNMIHRMSQAAKDAK